MLLNNSIDEGSRADALQSRDGTAHVVVARPVDRSAFSPFSVRSAWSEGSVSTRNKWRHTVGIILLLVTVMLWTASNFLASTIFADNTYSKPYFVTYLNTAFFIIPIFPMLLKQMYEKNRTGASWRSLLGRRVGRYTLLNEENGDETAAFLKPDDVEEESVQDQSLGAQAGDVIAPQHPDTISIVRPQDDESLTLAETIRLSFEFCMPWFLANYLVAACLGYTSVASSTILNSTSSIWTLLMGSLIGVERFTLKKLLGVLASLAGIILISSVDLSGDNDQNRGSFPHKSQREIIIGDFMAFLSAVLYGFYAVLMKKRIDNEERINMPLFFGLIGIINVIVLWPGLVVLHLVGVEEFEMPPTNRVWTIVVVNSIASLIADIAWAYATLLTSPLIVTVGLSLTIPLSLIGQMVLDAQYSSAIYWVGAFIVFLSFIFINRQESKASEQDDVSADDPRHG